MPTGGGQWRRARGGKGEEDNSNKEEGDADVNKEEGDNDGEERANGEQDYFGKEEGDNDGEEDWVNKEEDHVGGDDNWQ